MKENQSSQFTLYHYWRSSASWRVRWALQIKKIQVRLVAVDLLNGESESAEHLNRHPLGYVPVLQVGDRKILESVAMVEWLEENHPTPSLYPGDSFQRAHIRALAEIVNSDTQPIQNIIILDRISDKPDERKQWAQFVIRRGLNAFQTLCAPTAGRFSVGNQVTAADLFLIPQCYNAIRYELDLKEFPLILNIYNEALQTPECQASHPDRFKP